MRSLFLVLLLAGALCAQDEGSLGVQIEPGPVVVQGSGGALRPGDQIVTIDGVDVRGMQFTQALGLLRRPVGSKAAVEVLREPGPQRVTVEVTWLPYTPNLGRIERVRERKLAMVGVVERCFGQKVTIMLQDPVARAFAPGALVAVMPDETVVGEGRVTRVVSHYRLEAELKPGSVAKPWERVVVTP